MVIIVPNGHAVQNGIARLAERSKAVGVKDFLPKALEVWERILDGDLKGWGLWFMDGDERKARVVIDLEPLEEDTEPDP